MDLLETFLETIAVEGKSVQAVWCQCPSNPLLRVPDLLRLRKLADRYGFLLVVDETIGTFGHVDLLGVVDFVVTSLTKTFSGYADVMGGRYGFFAPLNLSVVFVADYGSFLLNPSSPHYNELKIALDAEDQDDLETLDAIRLEINSRDFLARVAQTNVSAAYLVTSLLPFVYNPRSMISRLYYPTLCPRSCANYTALMRT